MAKKAGRKYELTTHTYPKSPIAEAYRTLRTNLGFTSIDQPYRSILISSANPRDGKSTITSNLAVVMAQAGNKVILVDSDLRKPVLHRIFQVENDKGFTNCLMQNLDVEEVAYSDLVENLSVLTSGPIPPNPAEILGSRQTSLFWPSLMEKYDYVLIDAPPILAVTDTSIVSSQVDGVIIVVDSASTRKDLAQQAKKQLVKANATIIGVVLNQVKMNKKDYQYYY